MMAPRSEVKVCQKCLIRLPRRHVGVSSAEGTNVSSGAVVSLATANGHLLLSKICV